ncbi:haloacid dehalogenase superfamily, subfamily IA, variant 3 with third motif having DD or ED [Saccharopolyspora kobensis]|uniref:D,D-heptose 1,7-bisphosphate phosphatase n=1 Tax=Saccharopolyspora kobensis TaxID=146035 RepID=A0A1H6AEC4_9PSEU|nr:HAD-IIIA family hydrolase [Saccharopolyspora kobensis]SEG46841.1 haloacid dehalogenase superfamily, subfamily IA, variant 3 with third motif having DD or ED [Saccharopolyspora kobensis]SFE55232.1 haloacid dehalogenase superfamily, subfamily IA, variant 3 with third motif having DD or ED [Saccharopolyspora kobensis]
MSGQRPRYAVVIPTTGRASLATVLRALDANTGHPPEEVLVVDDRPQPSAPLELPETGLPVWTVRSGGRGPAAARNAGWRIADSEWVVFLDDDVVPDPSWREQIAEDLDVGSDVGACQATIRVPLPGDRRPTDWERGTAGLATAWWITADMAYRREVLDACGGFDEEFHRAFREDADLALRAQAMGWRLVTGSRITEHPVRPAGFLASVRAQAGNADNAIMRRKYGRRWRHRIGEGPGRIRRHFATAVAGVIALTAACGRRPGWRTAAKFSATAWLVLTAEFWLRRILPGPRTPGELARMAVTSVLIPPVACWHRLRGEVRNLRRRPRKPAAVLFDRDDTLIRDVPYNGDPTKVRPMRGARGALDRLRVHRVPIGIVSNQSGVARGLLSESDLAAVNAEVRRRLGPFDTWQCCVHDEAAGCGCRKPAPGLIERAATQLRVSPRDCVVVGDTGADVEAAAAAGAKAILVPTERTRAEEITSALLTAEVAPTIEAAIARVLGGSS